MPRRRTQIAKAGEEGEVIAQLASDEAFEGYWRRPEADAKAIRDGWYFTGDTGYFDADGDLFVTGRVDDMIITGGENVSPVEIESCLSLHPAVSGGRAVVGLADERWGAVVAAFVEGRAAIKPRRAGCRLPRLRALPDSKPYALLCFRQRNPEVTGRQAVAPQARVAGGTEKPERPPFTPYKEPPASRSPG